MVGDMKLTPEEALFWKQVYLAAYHDPDIGDHATHADHAVDKLRERVVVTAAIVQTDECAVALATSVEKFFNGRKGMSWDNLDEEVRAKIREDLRAHLYETLEGICRR